MDIASSPCFNPFMRSGFLALCGFVVLRSLGFAQTPPVILEQPVGVVAYLTDAASLEVVVQSDTPPSFQWHRNGQTIHGATQARLTVSPITLDDHGLYHVVITNTVGSTTSFPALIFV